MVENNTEKSNGGISATNLIALGGLVVAALTCYFTFFGKKLEPDLRHPDINVVVKPEMTQEVIINQSQNQTNRNTIAQNKNENSVPLDKAQESNPVEESYTSFINTSSEKSEVSIIILDASGNISNSVSSAIAKVYRKAGKIASTGLIRSSFVGKPQFRELCEGNSGVIEKLKVSSYTDYLAIGKINFAVRPGKLVDGTIVCNASILITIISTQRKSIAQSFTISNANGNGVDESQAKDDALQKLLNKYYNEYSTL